MRSAPLAVLLVAALLSGCVVEDDPTTDDTAPDAFEQAAQEAAAANEPAASASADDASATEDAPTYAPHGEPERTDGPVTTGLEPNAIPGAWARQTITITNGPGDATLASVLLALAAGDIHVEGADTDHYTLAAQLEARALTEDAARAALDRVHLNHDDQLADRVLRLATNVTVDPPVQPIDPLPMVIQTGLTDVDLRVGLTLTVPATLALQLSASGASADLVVEGLHGPRLDVATSSGDLTVSRIATGGLRMSSSSGDVVGKDLSAGRIEASTSSGDITLDDATAPSASISSSSGDLVVKGTFDDLDVGTSSGDVTAKLAAAASGAYDIGSSSGDVVLHLADGAYHVKASTSSGDIVVDLPDGKVIEDEERHVEAVSEGYGDAAVATTVDVGTSSGDITVKAD